MTLTIQAVKSENVFTLLKVFLKEKSSEVSAVCVNLG